MPILKGDDVGRGEDHVFVPGTGGPAGHQRLTIVDPAEVPADGVPAGGDIVVFDAPLVPGHVVRLGTLADIGWPLQHCHQGKMNALIGPIGHGVDLSSIGFPAGPGDVGRILQELYHGKAISRYLWDAVEEPVTFQNPTGGDAFDIGIDHGSDTPNL